MSKIQAASDGFVGDSKLHIARRRIAKLETEKQELLEALNLANDNCIRYIQRIAELSCNVTHDT